MTAFLTNKGAESGSILPWVKISGSNAFSVSATLPRSGANSFRFSPGGSGGGIGIALEHTITDADLVEAMVGQVVNFVIWVAIEPPTHGGGTSGSHYRFRVRDDVGNGDWVNMFSGASPTGEVDSTYRQFVATRTIDANATIVYLVLDYFKAGTESAYKFHIDDLDMQAGGVGGVNAYPIEALTRVTSITYRYNRGVFSTEVGLGGVISDFDIPVVDTAPPKSYVSAVGPTGLPALAPPGVMGVTDPNRIPPPPVGPTGLPALAPPSVMGVTDPAVVPTTPGRDIPIQEGTGIRTTPEHHRILTEGFEDPSRLIPIGGGGVQEIQDLVDSILGTATTRLPVRGARKALGTIGLAAERDRMRELRAQGLSREQINRIIADESR